ncbi:MAG: hypothetical protein QE487_00690 [Fluviicola sp.]|nr:hypothetical protein [Fluviicola sp.]
MKATFNEEDILSLLTKVKIFNHQIGTYQLFTINDSFNYVVKLTNGTIFFTIEELEANANETLNLEMLTAITRRFKPKTVHPIVEEYEDETPVDASKKHPIVTETNNKAGNRTLVRALIISLIGLALFTLVVFVIQGLNSSLSNNNDQPDFEEMPTYDQSPNEVDYNEPVQKTDEELRKELLELEQSNPTEYVSAEVSWRRTLMSNVLVTGRIYNNASEATYKNVRLHVKILTETGYELGDHYYTLTEFIEPKDSKSFEFRAVGYYGKAGDLKYDIVEIEVE